MEVVLYMDLHQSSRKGAITWEYIAAFILGLMVILVILIFMSSLKEKILEGIVTLGEKLIGF
jgi:hypothetical protein